MTRLTDLKEVDTAIEFAETELVEQKGPYVELVNAPAAHPESAVDFLNAHEYDAAIVDAVTAELFGGNEAGSLYQHQAETIEAIERDDSDTILSVPTATGKTEAFFFPILNHCLSTEESGLKALVVYPMKTLSVDQLNRFITYLDHINQDRAPEEKITIGIWDGDTPESVGSRDYEIEGGSYIRGLECPRTDEKLRVMGSATVGTDSTSYSWIKVTRESIRQGADILLTNPEALDYMFVNDSKDTREILGSRPGQHPVKHIVYDEAHVWSGISGAAISLLTQRLKHFFGDRDPQVTMVSATVSNPAELASSLTGTPADDVSAIGFSSRDIPVIGEPDFKRFEACSISEVIEVLGRLLVTDESEPEIRSRSSLDGTITTLSELGLLTSSNGGLQVDETVQEWLEPLLKDSVTTYLNRTSDTRLTEAFNSDDAREEIVETVLAEPELTDKWREYVIEKAPEVAAFAQWFETDTTGSVGFKKYDALLEQLATEGAADPEGAMEAIMTFGRLAGIVTEKYHAFLKPPSQIYSCRDCGLLSRSNACPECGERIPELRFCKRCHTPYVEDVTRPTSGQPEDSDNDADVDETDRFIPLGGEEPVDSCPGCGQYVTLTDIEVPTSTLLSFMLTEVCRTAPSKKTLVFSDSHAAAESVGSEIIETEYGLMAESLYVQELLESDGVRDNYEAFQQVSQSLREAYYEPLFQNEIDEDSETFNILRQLRGEITANAMLHNCRHLTESAIVTPESLYQASDNDASKRVIGHALYTLIVPSSGGGFSMETADIDGLSVDKMCDRLANRLTYDRETIKAKLPDILALFLENRVLIERAWEDVRADIMDAGISQEREGTVFDYIEAQREWVTNTLEPDDQFESGIFTRNPKEDQSELRLIPHVSYCTECYSSYPIPRTEKVDRCPACGDDVETYDRFTLEPDGTYSGAGYADVDSEWRWPLDHWGYEVTRPLQDGGPEHIAVGIHKGNIPPTLRGAIEEGFRKDNPDVNIVSATPTMELGVDIGSLETVTQVGIPPTLTNYVQRSGRTGRTTGSSSLVMTVMRGQHPVDNHYYANLDGFFREFEDVRVPDAYDFKELLAGQVMTAAIAYLARNPHRENVLSQLYSLPEEYTKLDAYVGRVQRQFAILQDFVKDERWDELEEYIDSIFGGRGVEVLEEVFKGSSTLSLDHRIDLTFSQLTGVEGSSETNKRLTEQHDRLDSWLSLMGYLANYRDFGESFPVKFAGRQESIEFESTGRLYDMFPGEANGLGSVLRVHGSQYAVRDVHGTNSPIATATLCDNEECDRPFQAYSADISVCPHCREELIESDIHGIGSVECRATRGGEQGYNTRGIMSSQIAPNEEAALETRPATLFGLPATIEEGEFVVTDFVYAFERGHSQSPDRETLKSEALIEQADGSGHVDDVSWKDELEEVSEETYAPVGQRYHTQGVKFSFERAALEKRLDIDLMKMAQPEADDESAWPQLLASLEQAITKATTVVADCDQQDFRVNTAVTDDAVTIFIVDGRQGGNGITWQVLQDINTAFPTAVADVVECQKCADYCEECLLLSRTPPAYLENDLLNKFILRQAIGATA